MCGVVLGGISAGAYGYEAGQSGVGDIFGHFVHTIVNDSHERLSELAAGQAVGEHGLIALDWQSGNRSVLVDHELSGVLVGETLATKRADIYRALLEATAFGTRTIVETFTAAGLPVREFVVAGGLQKNTLLMQIYADVLKMPLSVIRSDQGPALGSAIHAAVAAGAYPHIHAAAAAMGGSRRDAYHPIAENSAVYDELFAEYIRLHDYFGRGGNDVMHRLRAIARAAHSRKAVQ
jgi:L-ribulokinase